MSHALNINLPPVNSVINSETQENKPSLSPTLKFQTEREDHASDTPSQQKLEGSDTMRGNTPNTDKSTSSTSDIQIKPITVRITKDRDIRELDLAAKSFGKTLEHWAELRGKAEGRDGAEIRAFLAQHGYRQSHGVDTRTNILRYLSAQLNITGNQLNNKLQEQRVVGYIVGIFGPGILVFLPKGFGYNLTVANALNLLLSEEILDHPTSDTKDPPSATSPGNDSPLSIRNNVVEVKNQFLQD
ncbi:hypothetical protein B7463_g2607, partial [Scytalidium lignicola]